MGPLGFLARRGARRLLSAPRFLPDEGALGPALDGLGGEVVRLQSRDGLRLAGRWLDVERQAAPTEAGEADRAGPPWRPDPHEAVLVLHGWSGSVAPDLVEYGPILRRTAGVLGLDLRGHGGSADGATTFGLEEIEDVGGALGWLGDRGIRRVALFGSSMGGIVALAATAILGDGTLEAADLDVFATAGTRPPPRPRIVGLVVESVPPELRVIVASRLRGPARGLVADRILAAATAELGEDPRSVEPARMLPLLEGMPLLLIHGAADATVPLAQGRRLAAIAGPATEHWIVEGAGHGGAHRAASAAYEARVTGFLRRVLGAGRG